MNLRIRCYSCFGHSSMLRFSCLATLLLAIAIAIAIAVVAPAFAYDASWWKGTGWTGEWPNGFTITADVTINIRASLDREAPRSVSCLLRKGATYHVWNERRVVSDRLEFVSFTKIALYELNANITTHLVRKSDMHTVIIKFKKGDRYSYLTYGAEGSFLIRFGDTIYMADQDLADKSTEVGKTTDNAPSKYDEWLKLKCANGTVGWIFVRDIRDAPGFSEANIVGYGTARDQP